jgi:O-antigen ligase
VRLLLLTLAVQSVIYAVQSTLGVSFTLEGDVIAQDVVPRPGGTVSTNPAGFASFIMPLLLIAVARLTDRERQDGTLWLLAVIGLGLAAIGLTYTRVAWAGLAGALVWLFVAARARGKLRPSTARWVIIGAVVAGVACWPLMAMRLAESPNSEAYEERAGLMRIALEVVAAHPLTGIGTGAYSQRFKDYLPGDLPDQWLYTVHNEYLLRAAEVGVVGGVAFVALLVAGFGVTRRLIRAPDLTLRTLGLGCSAGLLALAWQMYWVPWRGFEYNAMLWFLLGVCDAAAARLAADAQDAGSTEINRGAAGRAAPGRSSAPRSGADPLQGT